MIKATKVLVTYLHNFLYMYSTCAIAHTACSGKPLGAALVVRVRRGLGGRRARPAIGVHVAVLAAPRGPGCGRRSCSPACARALTLALLSLSRLFSSLSVYSMCACVFSRIRFRFAFTYYVLSRSFISSPLHLQPALFLHFSLVSVRVQVL